MNEVKKVDDSVLATSCVEKIRARLARDVKRKQNFREVYTYRKDGVCSDNLLLLESVSKDVHGDVFKSWYTNFSEEEKNRYKGLEVVHVGTWDKLKFKFFPVKVNKVIFKCS